MAKKKLRNKPFTMDPPETRRVTLRLVIPSSIEGSYANNMLVQQDDNAAYLSFFLAPPPMLMGTPDQIQEQLKKLDTIEGRFVTQVIIPKDRLEMFAKALLENVQRNKEIGEASTKSGEHQ